MQQNTTTMEDALRAHDGSAYVDRAPKSWRARTRRVWSARRELMRAAQRGTTLVEVLIVVAIIAMVAGGVAFFAFPKFKEAQTKSATTGARVIRGAAQNWQMTNDGCPTISQLIQDKQLDKAQETNDPWGGDYNIVCTDDDIVVTSDGADKKKNTKDDISVPKAVSAEDEG